MIKLSISLIVFIFLIGFVLFSSAFFLYFFSGDFPLDYGIVIDAGSSQTTFFLYSWNPVKSNKTVAVKEVASLRYDKSVHKLLFDESINTNLLSFLTKIGKNVVYTDSITPIYLGATAGMRLLEIDSKQNATKTLQLIKENFEKYTDSEKQFKVENVEIIDGEKEGLFCWVTMNYLLNFIPPNPPNKTIGILDMGGSSTQIAFETAIKIKDDHNVEKKEKLSQVRGHKNLTLFNKDYEVYTYSNLCFGSDDSYRRYRLFLILKQSNQKIHDPCMFKDQLNATVTKEELLINSCTADPESKKYELVFKNYTFIPKNSLTKCQQITNQLVDKNEIGSVFKLSTPIITEPPPQNMKVYALSSYYYTFHFLLDENKYNFDSEEDLDHRINKFCNKSWLEVAKNVKQNELIYYQNLCFRMNYVFTYLKNVHQFKGTAFRNIEFRKRLGSTTLGWSLGHMLYKTNFIQGKDKISKKSVINVFSFSLLTLFAVLIMLFATIIYLKLYGSKKGGYNI